MLEKLKFERVKKQNFQSALALIKKIRSIDKGNIYSNFYRIFIWLLLFLLKFFLLKILLKIFIENLWISLMFDVKLILAIHWLVFFLIIILYELINQSVKLMAIIWWIDWLLNCEWITKILFHFEPSIRVVFKYREHVTHGVDFYKFDTRFHDVAQQAHISFFVCNRNIHENRV